MRIHRRVAESLFFPPHVGSHAHLFDLAVQNAAGYAQFLGGEAHVAPRLAHGRLLGVRMYGPVCEVYRVPIGPDTFLTFKHIPDL